MVRPVALTTAIALIAVSTSAQAAPRAPRPSPTQGRAQHLLWRAYRDVERAHPRCNLDGGHPRLSHGTPAPSLLRRYGVLSRPAGSEDALPANARTRLQGQTVFTDWVRVVHAADGQSFYVVPGKDTNADRFGPRGCDRLRRQRLERLLVGERPAVRRLALRWQRQSERFSHPRHVVVEDAIWVYRRGAGGAVGVEVADASFSRSGTGSGETAFALGDGRSLFVRLVRDGAATASGVFGRRAWRPGGRPHLYPSRLTVSAPIVDNVLAIEVPRSEQDAYPDRLIFRAANGTVVGTDPATDW
jgi:hypothetical protein